MDRSNPNGSQTKKGEKAGQRHSESRRRNHPSLCPAASNILGFDGLSQLLLWQWLYCLRVKFGNEAGTPFVRGRNAIDFRLF